MGRDGSDVSEATGAVVGVYESMEDTEAAVRTLLEQGVPAGQVSILGRDLHTSDAQILQQDTSPVEVAHHDDLVTAVAPNRLRDRLPA